MQLKILIPKRRNQSVFTILIFGFLFSQELEDIQFWNSEKFKKTINNKNIITLEQSFRFFENMNKLHYFHFDFGYLLFTIFF